MTASAVAAGLAWRLLTVAACCTLLAVLGLVVQAKTPIYWWMNTPPNPLPIKKGAHFSANALEPMLGHVSNGSCNVLLSQHAHTRHSDGSMSVKQVLDWHAAQGYTAVAITDHNTFAGGVEAARLSRESPQGGVIALAGMEWSHCRGHYNFILPYEAARSLSWDSSRWAWVSNTTTSSSSQAAPGNATASGEVPAKRLRALQMRAVTGRTSSRLQTDDDSLLSTDADVLKIPLSKYPTEAEFKEAFATVHALGGIVVVNHLPWSTWNLEPGTLPSRQTMIDWKVDYVELAHEMYLDAQSLSYVRSGQLGALAGGDLHFPTQNAYGWTCLHVANPMSEADIFAALRKPASVDVVFDAAGSPPMLEEKFQNQDPVASWPTVGQFFAPLRWFGEYMQSFYYSSAPSGGKTYAYSFVDGFCGAPVQVYHVRWAPAGFAVLWVLIFFCGYHALFAAWAKLRGHDIASAL